MKGKSLVNDFEGLLNDLRCFVNDFEGLLTDLKSLLNDFESLLTDLRCLLNDIEGLLTDLKSLLNDFESLVNDLRSFLKATADQAKIGRRLKNSGLYINRKGLKAAGVYLPDLCYRAAMRPVGAADA